VELEIWPTPSEAEREAIAAALEGRDGGADSGRGAWWEAGVRENLDGEIEEP
jgi:hypothetical protein